MRTIALLVFAGLAAPMTVHAVASCPDKAPAAITPAAGLLGIKCQDTIASEATKYLGTKMKVMSACKLKFPAGLCPLPIDVTKIQKAALKAKANVTKYCGADAAQAALPDSYGILTDDTAISSCTLSQMSVIGDLVVAETHGPTSEVTPGTGGERLKCVKDLGKSGWEIVDKLVKNSNKCVKTQIKAGATGNLAPVCVGSFAGGVFTPPTDPKTALSAAKLFASYDAKLLKSCGPVEALGQIETMFGCAGAEDVADLQACIACGGFSAAVDALNAEYSETGTFVANGPGALQAAVDVAPEGAKLLIGEGTYNEEVLITTDELQLIGCGAATNVSARLGGDRPLIAPPAVQVAGRGIRAFGVNGLVFQSLATYDQNSDGIFVSDADGVTFRDIVGDGNNHTSYAVFPVHSRNITIELCTVRNVDDAGIYVGQSGDTLLRHNDVRNSVAGIEFENTVNGRGYGNYATGNTGGILVFNDPNLLDQSGCHEVHHNLFEANNHVNFGSGTVSAVPVGTGFLIIGNDDSSFHDNIARNHKTFGLALIDQDIAFPPGGPDPTPDNNYILRNILKANGGDPDPNYGIGADIVVLESGSGNCKLGNTFDTGINAGNASLPACTLPPTFPTCPATPLTTTTTTATTSTTSTTDTSTTTTTESSTTTTT